MSQETIYEVPTEPEKKGKKPKKMGVQKNRTARRYRIGPYFSEQA